MPVKETEANLSTAVADKLVSEENMAAGAARAEEELAHAKAKGEALLGDAADKANDMANDMANKAEEKASAELDAGKELAAAEYDAAKLQAAAAAEKASGAWDSIMEMITSMFAGAKSAADELAAREEAAFMVGVAGNPELVPELRKETSEYLMHFVRCRTISMKKKMPLPEGEQLPSLTSTPSPSVNGDSAKGYKPR